VDTFPEEEGLSLFPVKQNCLLGCTTCWFILMLSRCCFVLFSIRGDQQHFVRRDELQVHHFDFITFPCATSY
jgi:hypothetical protein